ALPHLGPLDVYSTAFFLFSFIVTSVLCLFFFFNDTATTEIYTLSLHDALPISWLSAVRASISDSAICAAPYARRQSLQAAMCDSDRKSTRLNSSHSQISYAVFCLKKKKKNNLYV